MPILKSTEYKIYSKFLNNLARKLTRFYYSKLNKPFQVSNKKRGRGYDPVTSADKAFEKFIMLFLIFFGVLPKSLMIKWY